MKFIQSIVLFIILFASPMSAQHLNYGVKAGLNFYNISSSDNNVFDSKIGFHAGGLAHIHLAKRYAIQPEVMFSTQGRKYKVSNINQETTLGYINIPVLFQYMFNYGFRVEAGPQIGILISAKDSGDSNIKDRYKTIDIGVALGASYVHVPSGFGVDARYNYGISDINGISNSTVKWNNRGFQLGVFYLLGHH